MCSSCLALSVTIGNNNGEIERGRERERGRDENENENREGMVADGRSNVMEYVGRNPARSPQRIHALRPPEGETGSERRQSGWH